MKYTGNLAIHEGNAAGFKDLQEVTGHLYITADASLPALTSVGGDLYISADASLPALTSVGGELSISADASLPVLTSVYGVKGILLSRKIYGLWATPDCKYYAGCQRALTLTEAEALAKTYEDQDLAQTFIQLIREHHANNYQA